MDENQINFFISENLKKNNIGNAKQFYLGTFANDEIGSKKLEMNFPSKSCNFCFIFNSLTRRNNKGQGHWLLLHVAYMPILCRLDIKFVDSFAISYRNYGSISKYIDNLRMESLDRNIQFNFEMLTKALQHFDSATCGAYSCFTVMKLATLKQASLKTIFASFNPASTKRNDIRIRNYISKNWPVRSCTNCISNMEKRPTFSWSKKKGKTPPFCPVNVYNHTKCLPNCLCK